MRKLFKLLFSFVVLVLILGVVAIIGITQFVNPNDFKKEIAALMHKKTGRVLSIGGNIKWTFYPWLGLEMAELQLGNRPGFDNPSFATLDHIGFQVNFWHLLRGQIRINRIFVSGLNIHLTINANGQNNWDDLNNSRLANCSHHSYHPYTYVRWVAIEGAPQTPPPIDINIKTLNFDKANITLENKLSKNTITLTNAHLTVKNIQLQDLFPIEGAGTLQIQPLGFKNDFELQGKLLLDMTQHTLAWSPLNVQQTVTMPSQTSLHLQLTTLGFFNWKVGSAQVGSIKGTLDKAPLEADLSVTDLFTQPTFTGHFKATQLPLGTITFNTFKSDIKGKSGQITFSPMSATLYGGNIMGESFVDMNTHLYSTSGKFEAIDVAQLLKDSTAIDTLSGNAQGTYYFTSQGEDASALKQHLHGRGRLQVQQGVLTGVDLNYIFAQAKALLKGVKNTASDNGRTQFSQLSATIEAQDGILHNNDFRLSSNTFQLVGKGQYQLLDNFLDYTTQVVFYEPSETDGSPSLKKLPLGLRISGHPPKLVYLPDFETLFKTLLQQQIKTQSNKILDKLSSELGADFGEGAKNALDRGLESLQTLPFENAIQKQ